MWMSKKRYQQLEKRIADLEGQVQSQHEALTHHLQSDKKEVDELKLLLNTIRASVSQESHYPGNNF